MKLIAMQWIKFDKFVSSMLSCLQLITVMNIIYMEALMPNLWKVRRLINATVNNSVGRIYEAGVLPSYDVSNHKLWM